VPAPSAGGLLLKNGRVLDPGQGLDGLLDVRVRAGRIDR